MTPTDRQLIERYLDAGDHGAFRELVDRYLPLVHSAALRVTRDATLAEEVSQIVFAKLAGARNSTAALKVPLVVWLHRTTRSAAIDQVRSESSRRKREQAAALFAMTDHAPSDDAEIPWEQIAPLLDQALDSLPEKDRHLILARYFQGESHAEIAHTLGITLENAKKRSQRALEKLRELLSRRGITTTAAMLTLALPAHAATAVPTTLTTAVTAASLTFPSAAGSGASTLAATISAKVFSKAGLAAAVLVTAGVSVPAVQAWHEAKARRVVTPVASSSSIAPAAPALTSGPRGSGTSAARTIGSTNATNATTARPAGPGPAFATGTGSGATSGPTHWSGLAASRRTLERGSAEERQATSLLRQDLAALSLSDLSQGLGEVRQSETGTASSDTSALIAGALFGKTAQVMKATLANIR